MIPFLTAFWATFIELSPWLLLGAAAAGALHIFVPQGFLGRHLSGRAGVFRAVIFGIPLPLCSCAVIPTGLGLRAQGASKGASVGFLIATPQTGVDSMIVSASMLGWPFALFKVGAALVMGLFGGWLTDAVAPESDAETDAISAAQNTTPTARTVHDGLDHAVDLLRGIWGWIVIGVAISAAINAWAPAGLFSAVEGAGPLVALGSVLLISIPLYVCATASVPIAAALVAGGMPAGAALVFLMAGPATNIATLGAVFRTFGGRTLAVYLSVLVFGSLGLGLAFDTILPGAAELAATHAAHDHGGDAWWALVGAVIMAGLFGKFAWERVAHPISRLFRLGTRPGAAGGVDVATQTVALAVDGMTCNGCRSGLERKLQALEGVDEVSVVLTPGSATVTGAIDETQIRDAIAAAGYTPSPLAAGGGS